MSEFSSGQPTGSRPPRPVTVRPVTVRRLVALPLMAILLASTAHTFSAYAASAVPRPVPKPTAHQPTPRPAATRTAAVEVPTPPSRPAALEAAEAEADGDAALPAPKLSGAVGDLQQAVSLVENGQTGDALDMADRMRDPGSQALVRWLALRVTPRDVGFDRAAAILNAHPTLPTPIVLRRRMEYLLYAENKDPRTILTFFAEQRPYSGEGKIALARALFAAGDRAAGTAWLRDAWREDPLSSDIESTVMVEFGGVLTRADHKYRADKQLYAEDADRGMRAAKRAGDDVVALAKARIALFSRGGDPAKLLAAVPSSMRSDPAYIYTAAKIQRRAGNDEAAARLLSSAPKDPNLLVDTDEWWIERRLVSRELLDAGDPRTAYRVASDTVAPENEHKRADAQFTAGWIALRFLKDPRTALQHFSRVGENQSHPATVARGYYWQGRALEAMGSTAKARAEYEAAAGYDTAYYGQLARARLGIPNVQVHAAPPANVIQRAAFNADEGVMIFRLLQKLDRSNLAVTLAYDLAERLPDAGQLGMLANLAKADGDARIMTTIGKVSLGRGFALEAEAYPTMGIPKYQPIAPEVDRALVYAVARQESMFNATVRSHAGATGLMQVMPATGRTIARRNGVKFNPSQLNNPTVNVQFGAAELRSLLDSYQNNYVLTFAGYNAGRGNVAKWIAAYGDPRDPDVDPIDWVERIPYSETRNYVQRVMENAQVYKALFGSRGKLQIEADLRGTRL
ncbi:transglycosylase SLT domain-containing protein [Ancylobacter sp. MQZ15Z-1]|uniref:Transglycosylase SLT domain-containing protein n=1 Tax=Ancylobacter mangrovi TaxID=2972472 RepID=A0A9X2T592_9HYPH|nr:transglycosylase SLT domain-containing protein [Ancylobacter mangrovi]MCS0497031.1 transglycosylase SLT domain-containing protein [Ancylobacter mangrovi]